MTMRFIGDVHAQFDRYVACRDEVESSLQVGDMGAGFGKLPAPKPNHYWLRGNHDDPSVCINRSDCISRYEYLVNFGMMVIAGAYSTDWRVRRQGIDYWRDEELSDADLQNAFYMALDHRAPIVVTHCAPHVVQRIMGFDWGGRTSRMFDRLFGQYKPRLWVFGHYHVDWEKVIDGTRFVCVGKNRYKDIPL